MGINEPLIPDETLFELVNVGSEADEFLKHSPIGRHLYNRALQQYRKAVADFATMDPAEIIKNPQNIVALQNQMTVARKFIVWVDELVKGADSAEQELRDRDMSDGVID